MAIIRISRPADIALLRQKTGLETLPWATGFASERFYDWLQTIGSTLDIDTLELIALFEAIEVDEGHDDSGSPDTYIMDRVTRLGCEEATVSLAVQRIRSGERGRQVMAMLAKLATIANREQVIMKLSDSLLQPLIAALKLLEQARCSYEVTRYRPGANVFVDKLAVQQIRKLDEYLVCHPPYDDTTDFRTAGLIALMQLARDPRATASLSHRSMQLRIAAAASAVDYRLSTQPVRRRCEV